MKKIISLIMLSFIFLSMSAKDLFVYSAIGKVYKKDNTGWVALHKRDALTENDIIKVEANSALSIIDRKAEKIYSISKIDSKTVKSAIESLKDDQESMTVQFFTHAMKSLFNGSSDKISHEAAGCTYRGDIVENDIAKSLLYKHAGVPLTSIDNVKTDYEVSFEIFNRESDSKIRSDVKIGSQAYFRIFNKSNKALYVNIADINSKGSIEACLPMDDAQTQSHLLIPANSTIDLKDYPVEFIEPLGLDCLILVASEEPFDLRMVNKILITDNVDTNSKYPVGIYRKEITVK